MKHRSFQRPTGAASLLLSLAVLRGVSAAVDTSQLPPPTTTAVDFDKDIRPIFDVACLRCHGPERPKGGFRLDRQDLALKGGEHGASILPGDSANSPLIHFAARLVPEMEMPPTGRGEPLTPEQIATLRAWIDQGAHYPAGMTAGTNQTLFSVTPSLGWVTVKGNAGKFREQNWLPDGFSGGLQRFQFREVTAEGRRFEVEGHLVGGADDYRLKLSLEQPNLGFVHAGFEQYRKWFDDTGGYYAPFDTPAMRLNDDLSVRLGKAWIDLGLVRPGLPKLTVGYEYQYREGGKSTTQWGPVTDATLVTKAIYPSAKQVDEHVHIVKVDASHPIAGILFEDAFRGEFYDSTTTRNNVESFTLGSTVPDLVTRYVDEGHHFRAMNTLRFEKPIQDWLLLTGGYLYSDLDGNAAFSMETFIPSDPTTGPFAGDFAQEIVLNQQSHVVNGNVQVGPWQNFTVTAGVQAEWMRQHGFGNAVIAGFTSPLQTDLDRVATDETIGVRYTGLPYTVVFADARLQQETFGQFEQQTINDAIDDSRDFLRNTDARANLQDVRTGFTVSPWTRVSLSGTYRHRNHSTDYNHLSDLDASNLPGNGYPAFITARDVADDEVDVRAVVRVNRWLKTTFKYEWLTTDYRTATAGATEPVLGITYAGGPLNAATYRAHVASVAATLTPWRRWILTGNVSWAPSRTTTANTDGLVVAPYEGDVWTVMADSTYALDAKTDLTANYAFSRADYGSNNSPGGLPYGLDYTRHGVIAGLTRHLSPTTTVGLQYAFFWYREPTLGGAGDYTAHGVFATFTKVLP